MNKDKTQEQRTQEAKVDRDGPGFAVITLAIAAASAVFMLWLLIN